VIPHKENEAAGRFRIGLGLTLGEGRRLPASHGQAGLTLAATGPLLQKLLQLRDPAILGGKAVFQACDLRFQFGDAVVLLVCLPAKLAVLLDELLVGRLSHPGLASPQPSGLRPLQNRLGIGLFVRKHRAPPCDLCGGGG
jgi:hypothetical protein